jgi:putative phosphoesterase
MLIAIVADTHLGARRSQLPEACLERLAAADLLLHAGDVSTASALAELEALGTPIAAVYGNVDCAELRAALPDRRLVEAGGVRIGLIHDSGPAVGRIDRLQRLFPEADAVVFGHSHAPLHESRRGFQIFNPGSPTQRRRAPAHTMGVADAHDGSISFELVRLD